MQLAQCRFPGLVISNAEILIYFSNKIYTEATFSNSTRKLLWFEISKTPIAVKNKFIVLFIIISLCAVHTAEFRCVGGVNCTARELNSM